MKQKSQINLSVKDNYLLGFVLLDGFMCSHYCKSTPSKIPIPQDPWWHALLSTSKKQPWNGSCGSHCPFPHHSSIMPCLQNLSNQLLVWLVILIEQHNHRWWHDHYFFESFVLRGWHLSLVESIKNNNLKYKDKHFDYSNS